MTKEQKLERIRQDHQCTIEKSRLFAKYQMKQLVESDGQCILTSFWDAGTDEGFKEYLKNEL